MRWVSWWMYDPCRATPSPGSWGQVAWIPVRCGAPCWEFSAKISVHHCIWALHNFFVQLVRDSSHMSQLVVLHILQCGGSGSPSPQNWLWSHILCQHPQYGLVHHWFYWQPQAFPPDIEPRLFNRPLQIMLVNSTRCFWDGICWLTCIGMGHSMHYLQGMFLFLMQDSKRQSGC